MKNKILLVLLLIAVKPYIEAILECSQFYTMQDRNKCRQEVTTKYKYIDEDTIEINIFTLPKMQKNVVDFKEVFKDVE